MAQKPIFVTEPHLPPLDELLPLLERIWATRVLTNSGPFHRQFESALCDHLEVKHVALFTNATIALITALQSLRISGEVITSPYSFVATAHSLLWNGIRPVFVDVDPMTLNIDPAKIESAITPQTTAILPVHCYGTPCDTEAIRDVADAHKLSVIYDAAHAFGVTLDSGNLLQQGDLSVMSFHATKVFNTFEGGAIVCPDERSKQQIDRLKNFGFVNETTVVAAGINGKMNEFCAALGILQLQHISAAIESRRELDETYRRELADVRGLRCLPLPEHARANYAYFPIMVEADYALSRDGLYDFLKEHAVHARRYFYPLISDFPMYSSLPSANAANLPVATDAAAKVLCLPIYPSLSSEEQARIIDLIRRRR